MNKKRDYKVSFFKNSLNFFKSQSGNMLIFDDTDGKEKIQLIASGGSTRIEFDNENKCKINTFCINLEHVHAKFWACFRFR